MCLFCRKKTAWKHWSYWNLHTCSFYFLTTACSSGISRYSLLSIPFHRYLVHVHGCFLFLGKNKGTFTGNSCPVDAQWTWMQSTCRQHNLLTLLLSYMSANTAGRHESVFIHLHHTLVTLTFSQESHVFYLLPGTSAHTPEQRRRELWSHFWGAKDEIFCNLAPQGGEPWNLPTQLTALKCVFISKDDSSHMFAVQGVLLSNNLMTAV